MMRRASGLTLLVAIGLVFVQTAGGEETPPMLTLAEVASAYGFSPADVEAMKSGKPVLGKLEAVSDNELALSAMFLTPHPIEWHLERTLAARTSDPTVADFGFLEGDGRKSLEAFTLPSEKLDRLAKVEAGGDYNFSSEEIAALRSAAEAHEDGAERRSALLEAFRSILADRYADYRRGGIGSVAPYDRGDGDESTPAHQLRRALQELRVTKSLAPKVVEAMQRYPATPHPDVASRFVWVVNEAEGRVLASLAHRVFGGQDGSLVLIERRFFIHHTLNSMQAAAVAFPVEEGSVVLYANRTATDLVTGFGSSIAKGIGTTLMRREVRRLVDAFLESTE